jgi:hypothetical protein
MICRSDGSENNRNFPLYRINDELYIGLLPSRDYAIYVYFLASNKPLVPKYGFENNGLRHEKISSSDASW